MTLTPGPIGYWIYSGITARWPSFALGLSEEARALANITATFSFTTLGFLAAIITILFAVSSTSAFKEYRREGYLDLLFFLYFFTLACLVITALLSLAAFSSALGGWGFRVLMMLFVNNIIQVSFITIIISNLVRTASHET